MTNFHRPLIRFSETALKMRVFEEHFQSLGFSERFSNSLRLFMEEAHAELRISGDSLSEETLRRYHEIVSLAATYGTWHPTASRIDNELGAFTESNNEVRNHNFDCWLLDKRDEANEGNYSEAKLVAQIDNYRRDSGLQSVLELDSIDPDQASNT